MSGRVRLGQLAELALSTRSPPARNRRQSQHMSFCRSSRAVDGPPHFLHPPAVPHPAEVDVRRIVDAQVERHPAAADRERRFTARADADVPVGPRRVAAADPAILDHRVERAAGRQLLAGHEVADAPVAGVVGQSPHAVPYRRLVVHGLAQGECTSSGGIGKYGRPRRRRSGIGRPARSSAARRRRPIAPAPCSDGLPADGLFRSGEPFQVGHQLAEAPPLIRAA